MQLILLLILLPLRIWCEDFDPFFIKVLNRMEWKNIAKSNLTNMHSILLYCNDLEPRTNILRPECKRSDTIKQDYNDIAKVLQGFIKTDAYKISIKDFPIYIRLPAILVYMPRYKIPHVIEIETNNTIQEKSPGYFIITEIVDLFADYIRYNYQETEINTSRSPFLRAESENYINDPNSIYIIYVYEKEPERILYEEVEKAVTSIYNMYEISKNDLKFAKLDVTNPSIKKIFDWNQSILTPSLWFHSPSKDDWEKRCIRYKGRFVSYEIVRWMMNRFVETKKIPHGTVQVHVKRGPAFLEQSISIENRRYLISTV